jgi:hypothetical protein
MRHPLAAVILDVFKGEGAKIQLFGCSPACSTVHFTREMEEA